MISASPLIGISITTRDRWDDLEITLSHLRDEGLDSLETVVIDDGSASPVPSRFQQQFPRVRFSRSEKSLGYIVQRNRIARLLSTPLMLGLDDDSFPVAGNLEAAATWLIERPKVAALALRLISRNDPVPNDAASRTPFPVRDFVGCANLIKRDVFLSLGGYEERFEFYTEEAEFCLSARQHGLEIIAWPSVVVRHNHTPIARNLPRRARTYIRNEMILALWFFPLPLSWLKAAITLPGILIMNRPLRKNWPSLVVGFIQAPFAYLAWPHDQKPRLTLHQYRDWKKLSPAATIDWNAKP